MSRATKQSLHLDPQLETEFIEIYRILNGINSLWDANNDTGIEVERGVNDDTVRLNAGGNTDIVKVTSSKVHINDDANDVNFQVEGTSEPFGLFYNAGSNALGLGTDDPTYTREGGTRFTRFGSLKADSATSNAGFFALASTAGQRAVDIEFLKCSGTWASKGAVASGDVVLNLAGLGHDGTDFNRSAVMQVFIDGAVSGNIVPMGWAFQTSATNGAGLATRMRIRANGIVQLGGPIGSPTVAFNANNGVSVISQTDTAAALPTLTLSQADVDEPFLKYIGTAAAANLTRNIVDVGDVTTATVAGYVKIEVDDLGNQIADQDYFMPVYTLA
jgi:hypothetical protein